MMLLPFVPQPDVPPQVPPSSPHIKLKLKLTVSYFSAFITTHNVSVPVDSNSSIPVAVPIRHVFIWTLFLAMIDIIVSQNIDPSNQLPCIHKYLQ
jgi:hypothetical protein